MGKRGPSNKLPEFKRKSIAIEIRSLQNHGVTYADAYERVAEKYGISEATVRRYVNKLNPQRKGIGAGGDTTQRWPKLHGKPQTKT